MRTVTAIIASLIPLASVGCAKPVMLKVMTTGTPTAHLSTVIVKGDTPTRPAECDTPCAIELAPKSAHRLRLMAAGYYPATFEVTYDNLVALRAAGQGKEGVLQVPMIERPAGPVP